MLIINKKVKPYIVITKLMGGLGNQMFQYAMARRIAHTNNVQLKLDITEFNNHSSDTPRSYELKHFNIIENFASKNEINKLKGKKGFNGLATKLKEALLPYYKKSYVKEKSKKFDVNILKASKNVYFNGYWQSEKYFKDIKNIICSEFTVKHEPDNVNKQLARTISECESVSIHIRRGDYVANPQTNRFHGLCPLEYYYKGIKIIDGKLKKPHFFVFSDDITWVKKNLNIKSPVKFVSHNDVNKSYEDLHLMSRCKHHIIANSSFSWWGAWLNKNPEKIVIAPKKWFNDKKIYTRDITPKSWKKI